MFRTVRWHRPRHGCVSGSHSFSSKGCLLAEVVSDMVVSSIKHLRRRKREDRAYLLAVEYR